MYRRLCKLFLLLTNCVVLRHDKLVVYKDKIYIRKLFYVKELLEHEG